MLQGSPLTALFPEDQSLGDRFWYWRGHSGQRYIHSIYRPDLCPALSGASFVLVSRRGSDRVAVAVGRLDTRGAVPRHVSAAAAEGEQEIHVHLLTREEEASERVYRDLCAGMMSSFAPAEEVHRPAKPVQLDLLAA